MITLIAAYVLCHGLMLFNRGLFWDDWTLVNTQYEVIISTFNFIGFPWLGHVHWFLVNSIGIAGYRWIIFSAYLLAGLSLYCVLIHLRVLKPRDCLWIVLLFMVFPVNSARIALINSVYAVCYALFFIAWWLTAVYGEHPRIWLRVLIFVLFFVSFATASLLVFYLLVLLYLWYTRWRSEKRTIVFHYADWIVNPLLYWGVKTIWFQPYGPWVQYNHLTPSTLLAGLMPQNMASAFIRSFFNPLTESFGLPAGVLLVLSIGALMWTYRHYRRHRLEGVAEQRMTDAQLIGLLIMGGLAFVLAHYPYFAVGRTDTIPTLYDWFSRHQLLVPLGAACMVYALLYHINTWIRHWMMVWLFMLFVIMNWAIYTEYQCDFLKQQALARSFAHSEVVQRHHTFYVNDQLTAYNARSRGYRTLYEYQGLFKQAFHSEDRLAMDYTFVQSRFLVPEEDPERSLFLRFKYFYNLADYQVSPIDDTLTLRPGPLQLDGWTIWKVTWDYFLDRDSFERDIVRVVDMDSRVFMISDIPQ